MDDEARERYASQVAATIDRVGVFIQAVGGGSGPPFAYTVGLLTVDHPELIVFGLDHRLSGALLNDLAYSVLRGGMRYSSGDRVHHLVEHGFAWLVTVDDSTEHLPAAHRFRDGRRQTTDTDTPTLSALQVVLADRNGAWPWDPRSEWAEIPILGRPPKAGEGSDQTLPDAMVRQSQGW